MRIEAARLRAPVIGAWLAVCLPLAAFEPGSNQICEPSADGQRFVCRDATASAADAPEPAPNAEAEYAEPIEPAFAAEPEPEPDPAPAVDTPSTPDTIPSSASKLPSYLMNNRASAGRSIPSAPATSTTAEAPAPAPAPATSQAESAALPAVPESASPQPAVAPAAAPATAPMAKPAESGTRPTMAEPAAQAAVRPVEPDKPASAPPAATTSTSASVPAAAPARATRPAPRDTNGDSSATGGQRPPSSAGEFLQLPGNHYTLVLDSARSRGELDALIAALGDLPGTLYLIALNMPDGRWYSLCWSDFDSLDAARAARARLPADAPIASGWPRRISLLQSEIK